MIKREGLLYKRKYLLKLAVGGSVSIRLILIRHGLPFERAMQTTENAQEEKLHLLLRTDCLEITIMVMMIYCFEFLR